jgi:PAS domain S-box-containing protein
MDSQERRAPRILLVEDDPVDRMAVERLFVREVLPYELMCAGTVAEAVEVHREHPPDLALLDHGLPDGTGLELQALLEGTPCVFITGDRDVSPVIQAMKSGAFDFLVKDTARTYVELLPSVIDRALELHRLRETVRRHTEELDELVIVRTRELEGANERLHQEITERLRAEEELREERNRLECAQEAAGIGFLDWDLASNRIAFSDQIARMYGVDPAKDWITPEFVAEVVHPDDLEFVQARLDAAIRCGEPYDVEHRIVRPDGTILWTHSQAELILGEDGEPVRLLGTSVDITEQVRAVGALRKSEEKYRGLFENSVVGMGISSNAGELLAMNRALTQMTGYTLEEFSRINLRDIYVDPDGRKRFFEIVQREGMAEDFEARLRNKDGELYWASLSSRSIRYDGEDAFLTTAVDITERKLAEAALRESEALLAESQRVAGLGSYSLDIASGTWSSSPVLDQVFGIGAEYSRNVQGWLEIVHPDDRPMMHDYLATNVLANHERFDKAYRINRVEDGAERCVHGLGELGFDTDGNLVRMIGTIQDITEQMRLMEALRASEQRFRSLFEHVPVALWEEDFSDVVSYLEDLGFRDIEDFPDYLEQRPDIVADCAGRVHIIALNDAALALHEAENREELLREMTRTFTSRSQEAFLGELVAIWRGADSYETKAEVQTLSGALRHTLLRWSVPPGGDDPYSRVFLSISDVTELETARTKLREMNLALEHLVDMRTRQLVATNDELEAFVYSVSHDLKAPLRAIDGYSGMLEEGHGSSLPEDGQRLLGVVRSNAQQMARLIDDLLAFSRIGRADMVISSVDMRELAQTVFSDLLRLERGRTVEFSLGELPTVRADLALLRQVWANLLQNALKFTRCRDAAQIDVDHAEEPDHWVFRVRDNGAGFDMAYVDNLFGVFQRLHAQEEFPGTGVGLATVHQIVHRHGGEVWAEGEVDAGATLFFRLPRTAHVR